MPDYAFYHVGFSEPQGLRRAVVPVRRVLRRLLRPMFLRLAEIFQHLGERQETLIQQIEGLRHAQESLQHAQESLRHVQTRQAHQLDRLVAYRWDYGAVVHRLAVLEEQVETLLRLVPDARAAVPETGPIPTGRHWLMFHPNQVGSTTENRGALSRLKMGSLSHEPG